MSQSNQPVQATAKSKMVTIRMLPHKGKMLVGRVWRLSDGSVSETLPANPQERLNPEDVYLMPREFDKEGNVLEGPTLDVPESLIANMLGKDGKPTRLIDGYNLIAENGQEFEDANGRKVSTRTNYSPGATQSVYNDPVFEIVKRAS